MYNVAEQYKDSDPGQARHWYELAAQVGYTNAMVELGNLLAGSDVEQARRWFEQAVQAGNTVAMYNLAVSLQYSDPDRARFWLGMLNQVSAKASPGG